MKGFQVLLGFLILVMIAIAGCTSPDSVAPHTNGLSSGTGTGPSPSTGIPLASVPERTISPHPRVTASGIPLLLTDTDWQVALGCRWTEKDIPGTESLLMNNCEVRTLLADGWKIQGIGYDMNLLGSRCRMSTHPDAPGTCDWCLDSGPTLVLEYNGLTTEYLANMKDKTVTRFMTDLPPDATSISTSGSNVIMLRNGTILYTFRKC
jgi:hypothetical protein